MIKIYLIAPLVALAIFAAAYPRFSQAYHARLDQAQQVEQEKKKRKLEEQALAQGRAHREATAAVARRQAERAQKDHMETAQKQARLEAEQRRVALLQQETRLRTRLERLRADLASTGESVQRREAERRELDREDAFLADYVQQADANRESLVALLEKFETVERQRLAIASPPPAPGKSR